MQNICVEDSVHLGFNTGFGEVVVFSDFIRYMLRLLASRKVYLASMYTLSFVLKRISAPIHHTENYCS